MADIRKSLLLSFLSRYTVSFLALASIIITARLLTPEELGVYAIASAFILFANEFKSLGTGTYLIRNTEIEKHNITKATGLMVVISWGAGITIFLVSGEVGDFYQIADVSYLLKLLTFNFLVAPFISVPKSVFTRNFQFKELLIIDITTNVFLVGATIGFILLGHSYYSLAYAAIVGNMVELGLVFYFRRASIPLLPTFHGLSEIVKFGFIITLTNVFRRLSLSSTDLIIGKLGTTTDVAIFSRGLGFLDFLYGTIKQGVNPVALPYLSKELREGQDIQHAYLKAIALLGSVIWPTLVVAGLASYPIIIFLFGDQWEESVPIAKILCIWAFFRSIHSLSDHLLIATKNESHLLIREVVLFILTVVAIGFSFRFGLEAIAFSISIVSIINFLYTSILLKKLVGIEYLAFTQKVMPIILLVGVIIIEMVLLDFTIQFTSQEPIVSLSIVALTATISWLIGIRVLNLDIYGEIERATKSIIAKMQK